MAEKITPEIEAMAGGTTSATAVGGMITKISAAKLATRSGCGVFIASGSEPDIVNRLLSGHGPGTFFVPSGIPLEAKNEVVIQAPSGTARTMAWPGGAPERSDVITFEIDSEDELGPTTLVLAANGSASLRAERVVVAAPSEWSARWLDSERGGAPGLLGTLDDGRVLWLADGAVLI